MVDYSIATGQKATDFASFIKAHPTLLDEKLYLNYYTQNTVSSLFCDVRLCTTDNEPEGRKEYGSTRY
jgi:hypothetical protein